MRVLIVTAAYPTSKKPAQGTFIKEQVDSLQDANIDVDVFTFDGKGSVTKYLQAGKKLRILMNDKSYDIVHAHYGLSGIPALMQTGYPVVVTFHGSDLFGFTGTNNKYTVFGKVVSLISRCVAYVATQNIVVADVLKKKIWPRSAITIPMGVDLSLFKPMPTLNARKYLGLPENKKLVLFAANPKNLIKRYDIACGSVEILKKADLDVDLYPLYNAPHNQVPLYMNACDALIMTSMHEASPCIIKEAMACNLPIVSVNVGDVAERIAGVNGCYLCERTPSDLAEKLCLALDNGRLSNGRNKIAELSLQNIATRIIAVYHNILQRKH